MAKVDEIMKALDCTREEALQVIEDDKAIDKGEKLFELTAEQKKNAKKATITTGKIEKKSSNRGKKAKDEEKISIIADLYQYLLTKEYENVEIVNENRQISFKFGENAYELTLTKKRK